MSQEVNTYHLRLDGHVEQSVVGQWVKLSDHELLEQQYEAANAEARDYCDEIIELNVEVEKLEAKLKIAIDLAKDLELYVVHTYVCNNGRRSLDDCLCGLKELKTALKQLEET
jgi:hypothetical protein